MMRVYTGLKGSGKTKKLIGAVNSSINEEKGDVVCITYSDRLIHDIDRAVRLVNTEPFEILDFGMLDGFICGIISENYDITHIFVDSIFKIVPNGTMEQLDKFILSMEKLEEQFNVSFTYMVSAEEKDLTPNVKKYVV